MWVRIRTVVMLTLVGVLTSLPTSNNCFQLLGLDILVDQNLKPWLLEINASPALSIDGPVDQAIKPKLIKDLVQIVKQDIKKLNSKYESSKSLYTSKFASNKTSRPNSAIRTPTPKNVGYIGDHNLAKRTYKSSLSDSNSTQGFFQTGLTTSITTIQPKPSITPKSRLLSAKRNSNNNSRVQLSKKMILMSDRKTRQMIPPPPWQSQLQASQSSNQILGHSNSNSITLSNTSTATTAAQSINQRPPTSICIGKTGIQQKRDTNTTTTTTTTGILDRMTTRMLSKVKPESERTKQEVDQFLKFLLNGKSSMTQFQKLLKSKIKQDYNEQMKEVVEARRQLQLQPHHRAVRGLHHQQFKTTNNSKSPIFGDDDHFKNKFTPATSKRKIRKSIIAQQDQKSEINDSIETMRSTHSGF